VTNGGIDVAELKFRNLNVTPDDPVEEWGFVGMLAAIDRGSLRHLRRIIDAVTHDPDGTVARDLREVVEVAEDAGVVARMRRLLAQTGPAGE
jgi:hypothetical protein